MIFIFLIAQNKKNDLCCSQDIVEGKNTVKVARTVMMLSQFCQQPQQTIFNNNDITTIGNAMSLSITPQQNTQQQTAV